MGENPAFGGSEVARLPILTEDVERIEVVRGPGGGAWGANAFNGVINVITKRPEETQGVVASSALTEFGSTYSQFRFGTKTGNWAWRVSGGYEDLVDSDEATPNDSFTANDFRRQGFFSANAVFQADADTRFTVGLNAAQSDYGVREYLGLTSNERVEAEQVRLFAKLEHGFDADTSGYLQWFTNFDHWDNPVVTQLTSYTTDFEGQNNFKPTLDHQVSLGGNIRWMHFNPHNDSIEGLPFNDGR